MALFKCIVREDCASMMAGLLRRLSSAPERRGRVCSRTAAATVVVTAASALVQWE